MAEARGLAMHDLRKTRLFMIEGQVLPLSLPLDEPPLTGSSLVLARACSKLAPRQRLMLTGPRRACFILPEQIAAFEDAIPLGGVSLSALAPELDQGRIGKATRPALAAAGRHGPAFDSGRCAMGPMVAETGSQVHFADTIVDGYGTMAALSGKATVQMERSTVIGALSCRNLLARDSILAGLVKADNPDLAHCALPADMLWPSARACYLFEDVDRLSIGTALPQPDYGIPHRSLSPAIRHGVSDGGEMGATHGLRTPLREELAVQAMADVLPLGIAATLDFRR
jgi:hypothetical protein